MKYKEREKLWLKYIKELCKTDEWKFKGYFIYKVVNDLYFSVLFSVNKNENAISGRIGYKPLNIDNIFWDIIDEQPNKKMPLSFRAEAAFCVRELNWYEFKVDIKEELNPKPEIIELLQNIKEQVEIKSNKVKSLIDFRTEMLQKEKMNSVGIITSFIEQGEIDNALSKINEYKSNDFNSGFRFGDKDFYDLAKEYCIKNNAKSNPRYGIATKILLSIRKRLK
jgi:hypothetical protein